MSTIYAAVCQTTSLLLYVGCTAWFEVRVREHHTIGKCAEWRKNNGPVEFFSLCEIDSRPEALRMEAMLISHLRPLLNANMVSDRSRSKYLGPKDKWPKPRKRNYHPRISRILNGVNPQFTKGAKLMAVNPEEGA